MATEWAIRINESDSYNCSSKFDTSKKGGWHEILQGSGFSVLFWGVGPQFSGGPSDATLTADPFSFQALVLSAIEFAYGYFTGYWAHPLVLNPRNEPSPRAWHFLGDVGH